MPLRLHIVRERALEGKLAIHAAAVVDAEAYQAADAERRERDLERAAARRRNTRTAVTWRATAPPAERRQPSEILMSLCDIDSRMVE